MQRPEIRQLTVRTYPEIAKEIERRHGWRMTAVRVQQICAAAERKIRDALKGGDRVHH